MRIERVISCACILLGGMLLQSTLSAQTRYQFDACTVAVSERYNAAQRDITVDPGPVNNGNSVILWRTRRGDRGYCEVSSRNRIINLNTGDFRGGDGGRFGGNRISDGDAIGACRSEAARRFNTDQRDVDANVSGNNGDEARVNFNARGRRGLCTVDRNLRIVDFREDGGGYNDNNSRGPVGPRNDRPYDNDRGNDRGGGRGTVFPAQITGGREGKCTFEVEVDGVAEVEIVGDRGYLRTITGSPATWRRLECTQPFPQGASDFRFQGVDGRGRQSLVGPPRGGSGGVIRIEDPKAGREGYTGDIFWR